MTYTEVRELFQTTFDQVSSTGQFMIGRRPDLSLVSTIANDGWPVVCLAPFRERRNRTTGNMTRQCVLFFITQDSTNNSETDRDALVQQMETLADLFEQTLEQNIRGVAQIPGEILRTPERQTFPGYCTGYSIQFDLLTKIDQCIE
jgi:hypothetical protein